MPPKGSRGGRGTTGRGRGRGRGKASASSAAAEASSSTAPPEIKDEDDPQSQSTIGTLTPPEPAPGIITPENHQDAAAEDEDENFPSANSSPATVPTETPAPTPARPSTSRPGSATAGLGFSESPSSAPAMSSKPITGKKPTAPSRFKPKIVRREQGEREELAREELRRKELALAEAARELGRLNRGRGRGMGFRGRGRGDAMGKGKDERKTTAMGTFGVAPEALARMSAPGFSNSQYGGGPSRSGDGKAGTSGAAGGADRSGSSGIKKESTGGGGGGTSGGRGSSDKKDFDPEPIYPHGDDENMPRVDIELINLVSDDDEPYTVPQPGSSSSFSKDIKRKAGLKPVRLHREEHKQRVTIVNTDPSAKLGESKKEDGSDTDMPTVDELRSSRRVGPSGGNPKTAQDGVTIKQEKSDLQLEVRKSTKPGSSRRPGDTAGQAVDLDPPIDENLARAKKDKKARRKSMMKEKKPVIQTEEDRAEYMRHLEDVAILAKELGGMQTTGNKDQDGDVNMDGSTSKDDSAREGRLYLFQFPPVLPQLYNPLTSSKPLPKGTIIKHEDTAATKTGEKEAPKKGTDKGKQPQGSTALAADGKEIKTEEDIPHPKDKSESHKREEVVDEEGYIGKLIVRESGKVELCWGGTNLVVGRGVDAGFLTTGVVVDSSSQVQAGKQGQQSHLVEGKALGMGRVMGKFVVTPDWEKMMG